MLNRGNILLICLRHCIQKDLGWALWVGSLWDVLCTAFSGWWVSNKGCYEAISSVMRSKWCHHRLKGRMQVSEWAALWGFDYRPGCSLLLIAVKNFLTQNRWIVTKQLLLCCLRFEMYLMNNQSTVVREMWITASKASQHTIRPVLWQWCSERGSVFFKA